VKTDQNTTVTEFDDVSSSTAKTCIKIGDEIVRVGKENIVSTNAYQILTKKLPTESDDLVTVVVRRDGNDINCQIRPNKFN
jgi:C-terminal processing protease CtpA/Prc